jgi:spermidine synthase
MSRAWQTLGRVQTSEGPLELRQRGESEFLIVIAGRVLMTSVTSRSEQALAQLACARLKSPSPRVLIGGLGMGYTLRAALDALPKQASVVVAELEPEVVSWCRGPLAVLTGGAVLDPRVRVEIGDVARVIAAAPAGSYDAILLDLFEGPHAATQRPDDPFYGHGALRRARSALTRDGVLAVWSEDADAPFERRFSAAGFAVSRHKEGQGGRAHFVYLGVRSDEAAADSPGPRKRSASAPPAARRRTSRPGSPRPT